jgi:hypothetical protein
MTLKKGVIGTELLRLKSNATILSFTIDIFYNNQTNKESDVML